MNKRDQPQVFNDLVKPRSDKARKESVSLPCSYWDWIDSRVQQNGSDRSKVIRALVDFVRASEGEMELVQAQ